MTSQLVTLPLCCPKAPAAFSALRSAHHCASHSEGLDPHLPLRRGTEDLSSKSQMAAQTTVNTVRGSPYKHAPLPSTKLWSLYFLQLTGASVFSSVLECLKQITVLCGWYALKEFYFALPKTLSGPQTNKTSGNHLPLQKAVCAPGSQLEPNQPRPGLSQTWAPLSLSCPPTHTRLPDSLQELWSTNCN